MNIEYQKASQSTLPYDDIQRVLQSLVKQRLTKKELDKTFIATHEGVIKGVIGYEQYSKYAVIRYFLSCSNEYEIYIELIEMLINDAKKEGLTKIISFVDKDDVTKEQLGSSIFEKLQFIKVPNNTVYLEEKSILTTKFKNAIIMVKDIKKTS